MSDPVQTRIHAAGSEGIEKPRLQIGFIPLADCAPLVIAKERGFFRKHGLDVTLSRESSWASLRDKVVAGALDAAPMLAPMPLAAALGLGSPSVTLCTGLSLSLNGNAITVSADLHARLRAELGTAPQDPALAGATLARLIAADRERGRPPLRFGVVFPYSSHDLELRYWLAAAGIDPTHDVRLRVVPPPFMVDHLERDEIDGYCVGEPWNAVAAQRGSGHTLVTKHQIWNHSPEKLLGVSEPWLERHPNTHLALLRALLEAACWADATEHRQEVSYVLCGESFVDAPGDAVQRSLCGDRSGAAEPNLPVFYRNAATHPWVSHGVWLLGQMLRWGYIEKPFCVRDVAESVYRPEWHRRAASDLGLPAPLEDDKTEGGHPAPWALEASTEAIAMGPDLFFDGLRFDPNDWLAYLEALPTSALRVRLDELADRN
ncbi:MAG: CmpA/NrtA family ABC transporter substrate-binding protein [Myxococcota bacterium]